MSHPGIRLAIFALFCSAAPRAASALQFEPLTDNTGRQILFIRDCGLGGLEPRASCEPWKSGFKAPGVYKNLAGRDERYAGDSAILRGLLRSAKFDEVWLYSYGGALAEGVRVGQALRSERMQVRIPNHHTIRTARDCPEIEIRCVSSCTVAFMGGMFRYLDEGATYEVHSSSGVAGEISESAEKRLAKRDFMTLARSEHFAARLWARILMTHFQNTLLLPVQPPKQMPEYDIQTWAKSKWATGSIPPLPYTQEQAEADTSRLEREGDASAQDILMRIERDAMGWAVDELRQMDRSRSLGPRAKYALDMVEEMFRVSIKETDRLGRETMYAMGYLTQDLHIEAQD